MAVIRYLEREEIETHKWNQCIESASNSVIYAYAWYLDIITDQWGAVILNDYEAVMPLPWREKFGFCYIYTPAFANPLGIFAVPGLKVHVDQFLETIPGSFRLWDLNLSIDQQQPGSNFKPIKRQNYILDLNNDYPSLFKNFRTSYKQILNKNNGQLTTRFNILPVEVINFAKVHGGNSVMKASDYQRLLKAYNLLEPKLMAETVGVYSAAGVLLASGIFFKSEKRIYYILAGNNPEGRAVGASHLVLDAVIQKYAGQHLKLDFEGSDIPGIAFFFEGFGALKENYFYIHNNKLPWWCKWMKKANESFSA